MKTLSSLLLLLMITTFAHAADNGQIKSTPYSRLLINSTNNGQAMATLFTNQVTNIIAISTNIVFTSIATVTNAVSPVTATGATTNDIVLFSIPEAPPSGIIWDAWPSNGMVFVRANNVTAISRTPGTNTIRLLILQH